ncbi:hypothetical protein GCM10027053_46450 [Intrasporangium mesophilum]
MAALSLFFDIVGRDQNASRTLDRVGRSADQATRRLGVTQQQTHRLMTTIALLGPALVPVAAGATALGVAFGGMGLAGVAAFVGIRREMKDGTPIGLAYQATIDSLQSSLAMIEHTAAANVLGPFQAAVRDLNLRTPELNSQIGSLATIAGHAAQSITHGLLSAFLSLAPLMQDAAVYVAQLAARFDLAMSGPGIRSFGDYARSVLPQVTSAIESIAGAAAHLVQSLAPVGLGTLSVLRTLATVINAIPVPVLSALAQGATAVFLAFRAWQGLNIAIDWAKTLQINLGMLGRTAVFTAGAIRGLQIAAGVVGIALAGLTLLFQHSADQERQAQQAIDDYTEALRQSNGVIDQHVRARAFQHLVDSGAIDDARKLGLNLADVTNAALGNADAQARVTAAIQAQRGQLTNLTTGWKSGISANTDLGNAAANVTAAIKTESAGFGRSAQAFGDYNTQTTDAVGATANAAEGAMLHAQALQALATKLGITVPALQQLQDNQTKAAEDSRNARAQMALEGNAAGLLKLALDALNGTTQGAATAQNAFDSSLVNMGTHVTKTGKHIHYTSNSIRDMSAASVALRGELLGQVANAENAATSYGQLKGSVEAGRQKLIQLRKQIIDNAVAHGIDRAAVTSYINEVLKIPPKATTDVVAYTAKAGGLIDAFKRKLDALPRSVAVSVSVGVVGGVSGIASAIHNIAQSAIKRASGGIIPGFAGGTVIGPGTGTSDSVLAMIAQTGALLRVSVGEFISTAASTAHNRAALEAGNRGATLGVVGGQLPVVNVYIGNEQLDARTYRVAKGAARDEIDVEAREIEMGADL